MNPAEYLKVRQMSQIPESGSGVSACPGNGSEPSVIEFSYLYCLHK